MLLYYITDRTQLGAAESERRSGLLKHVSQAAAAGVDFIQLREKDLTVRELEALARQVVTQVAASGSSKVLINSRCDVAIAAGAHGVHLRSSPEELDAATARQILQRGGLQRPCVFVSCHSLADVERAQNHAADAIVLAPIFEKDNVAAPHGLQLLQQAAALATPPLKIFALGGVTLENAATVRRAGAHGVAGIRIFQSGDIAQTAANLRRVE